MILAEATATELTAGLGVIAAALVIGQYLFYKFVHTPALDRADRLFEEAHDRHLEDLKIERMRCDRLEAKVDRQSEVLEDKALPALIAATTTVSQFQTLMEELRAEQERLSHERALEEARQQAVERRS